MGLAALLALRVVPDGLFGLAVGLLAGANLIVGVLNNGMTLMNINSTWQQVAAGTLLILAVSFDQIRQRLIRG